MLHPIDTGAVETTALVSSEILQLACDLPDDEREREIQQALAERDFWRW